MRFPLNIGDFNLRKNGDQNLQINSQYQKVTKTKSVFPSDTALEKMLYLASENVVKKWTQRYRNWDQVLNRLIVLYGERLTNYL